MDSKFSLLHLKDSMQLLFNSLNSNLRDNSFQESLGTLLDWPNLNNMEHLNSSLMVSNQIMDLNQAVILLNNLNMGYHNSLNMELLLNNLMASNLIMDLQ
jgi:hypothetical protein